MTSDVFEVNNFVVMVDKTDAEEASSLECGFDDEIVGISFYSSGEVAIKVNDGYSDRYLTSKTGEAFSFFGNKEVNFEFDIKDSQVLKSVSLFILVENIKKLPDDERELFEMHLPFLKRQNQNFEVGPEIKLSPELHLVIAKIFESELKGNSRLVFLKSQVLELLSLYFSAIENVKNGKPVLDHNPLKEVKEILEEKLDSPPSLSELSMQLGMNSNKLQARFKEVFGVTVFKYIQQQRLNKAFHLLKENKMNVQETAWHVGYESLSSFSNAFIKQFGFRPSEL